MRVAIIGRSLALYKTALRLHEEGHDIRCVITSKAAPEDLRKEKDFEQLAAKFNAPFLFANTLDRPEVEKACKGLDIGASLNWPTVIQQRHIDLFRLGILNAHYGDLPQYRGNACPNWAILKNEKRIASTIHLMEGGQLDCGRIIHQDHLELEADATIGDIYSWADRIVPDAFARAIGKLRDDSSYTLRYADAQDPESFRCYPRLPEDGYIDWTLPVATIHNLIRAAGYPFSGAYTYHLYRGEVRKLIVLKSRIVEERTRDLAMPGHVIKNDKESGESHVGCGEGVIGLSKCRYENEPDDFIPGRRWNSIRMRLGVRAEDRLWNLHQGEAAIKSAK